MLRISLLRIVRLRCMLTGSKTQWKPLSSQFPPFESNLPSSSPETQPMILSCLPHHRSHLPPRGFVACQHKLVFLTNHPAPEVLRSLASLDSSSSPSPHPRGFVTCQLEPIFLTNQLVPEVLSQAGQLKHVFLTNLIAGLPPRFYSLPDQNRLPHQLPKLTPEVLLYLPIYTCLIHY